MSTALGEVVREAVEAAHPKLLIVDDEQSILSALKRALRRQSYEVLICESPKQALELFETEDIGVVISDYKMPEMDGIAFLQRVRKCWPNVTRIMLTGQADDAAIEGVINRSAVFRFLSKPWDHKALVLTLSDSFEQHRVMRENEHLWRLTQSQNKELKALNRGLEEKITDRTRQLSRAKIEWERTFDAIVDPVAIVNERHEVVRANIAYAEQAGCEIQKVPGDKCHKLVADRDTPCDGCPLSSALVGDTPRGVDVPAQGGRVYNVWTFPLRTTLASEPPFSRASPVADADGANIELQPGRTAVCYYKDVTDERSLQAQLARTEKLASLGLFVGGVAHEINNPLGGILAFTQLLLRGDDEDDAQEMLEKIESSALRCKRIIASLQSFAHGSAHLRRETIDLAALVEDAVVAFKRDYNNGDHVEITQKVDEPVPPVRGDAALLHQLLRNLLQNALHALAGREKARIDVRLQASHDQRTIQIEVTDNGAGIDADSVSRIFDPFFSTKGEKQGTGLGLSICHRIVEKHMGHIGVESRLGRGTSFRIELPAEGGGI